MRKKVVAIIDDQPLVLVGLKAVLKTMDCKVISFKCPAEALQAMEKVRPDCIMVDLMMPKMDGIEFTNRFRRLYGDECVPILLTSAFLENEILSKAFDAGVDDFLEKPAGSVLIRQRVKNMLKMKELEGRNEQCHAETQHFDKVSHSELNPSILVLEKKDFHVETDMEKAVDVATTALEKVCQEVGPMSGSVAAPTIDLKLSTFSLDSWLDVCCRSLGKELELRQQTLDCTLDSALGWMVGDKQILGEALTKMMTSAIQRSPSGTRIGIRLKRVPGSTLEIAVVASAGSYNAIYTPSGEDRNLPIGDTSSNDLHESSEDTFCELVATAHGGGWGYRSFENGKKECFLKIPLYGARSYMKNGPGGQRCMSL